MARLRWGIKTSQQQTTYEAIREVWREADANPAFEHAWLFDHFAPISGDIDGPCLEGWTVLAALVQIHTTTASRLAAQIDVLDNVVVPSGARADGSWGGRCGERRRHSPARTG